MSEIVTTVISSMLLILGLSYFFQSGQWVRLAKDAIDNPYRYFPMVLFILILGLTVIGTHNRWVFGWPVVITLMGWIMTVKGIVFLVFPQVMKRFAGWSEELMGAYIRISGTIMALIGGVLVYRLL